MLTDLLQPVNWMSCINLKDVYLSVSMSGTPTVSPLHMDGQRIRIHLLAIWADKHPKGFHQAVETCYGTSEETRLKNHHIPGQSADNEPVISEATMPSRLNSVSAGIAGLHCQQREVPAGTLPTDQISGLQGGLCDHEAIFSQGQAAANRSDVQESLVTRDSILRNLFQLLGKMGATTLAVLPAPLWYRNLQQLSLRRLSSYDNLVILDQACVMELTWWRSQPIPTTSVEWQGCSPESPRHHDRHRCLSDRLGGSLQQCVHRELWSLEERNLHINHLELLAGSFAVHAFTKDKKDLHSIFKWTTTLPASMLERWVPPNYRSKPAACGSGVYRGT